MEIKQCPKCSKTMNPVFNKSNPKAPDHKCSDTSCKWKKVSGKWVESDFITGAWNDPVPQGRAGAEQRFGQELDTSKNDEKWDKIGRGKTRCALAVALINAGRKYTEATLEELNHWTTIVFEQVETLEEHAKTKQEEEAQELFHGEVDKDEIPF